MFERVNFLAHPLLRQQAVRHVLQAAWANDGKPHVGEHHFTLGITVAVKGPGVAEGLEGNERVQQPVVADLPRPQRAPHVVSGYRHCGIEVRVLAQHTDAFVDRLPGHGGRIGEKQHHQLDFFAFFGQAIADDLITVLVSVLAQGLGGA